MANRYRYPLKLLQCRAWAPPSGLVRHWLHVGPMVVEWPGGRTEYVFTLIRLSAN